MNFRFFCEVRLYINRVEALINYDGSSQVAQRGVVSVKVMQR